MLLIRSMLIRLGLFCAADVRCRGTPGGCPRCLPHSPVTCGPGAPTGGAPTSLRDGMRAPQRRKWLIRNDIPALLVHFCSTRSRQAWPQTARHDPSPSSPATAGSPPSPQGEGENREPQALSPGVALRKPKPTVARVRLFVKARFGVKKSRRIARLLRFPKPVAFGRPGVRPQPFVGPSPSQGSASGWQNT